jgi:hypothetical protein
MGAAKESRRRRSFIAALGWFREHPLEDACRPRQGSDTIQQLPASLICGPGS